MQMKIVEAYNITELSWMEKTPYDRIKIDKDLYIPIKIVTAQSRATKRWYTVRYIKSKDVEKYLKENKNIRRYKKRLD